MTMISSARFTVWSLCATMMTVRHSNSVSSASVIFSSLNESSAEVGSSRRMISGFLRKIFAIARRCFCHHESRTHFSHISVSRPFSMSKTKSHWASRRAWMSASEWSVCSNQLSEWIPVLLFFVLLLFCIPFWSLPSDNWLLEFTADSKFSLIVASNTHGSCVR